MTKLLGTDKQNLGGDLNVAPRLVETYKSTSGADDTAALDDTIDAAHLFPGGFSRWIRTGGAGNLKVVLPNGASKLIEGMTAGETIQIQCVKILNTGTTATKIQVFF